MTQSNSFSSAESSTSKQRMPERNLTGKIRLVSLVLIVSLLAGLIAMFAADAFAFGDKAAAEAGENPPRNVSLRVASLMMWQAYLNALLTGIALGILLFIASRVLVKRSQNSGQKNSGNPFVCFSSLLQLGASAWHWPAWHSECNK